MINQRKNYEPGRAVKRFLLSVRKVARKFGSTELPGLFDVAYGTRDALLFTVAVILEVYGLYNLWLVGDILLMAAAGLFALDLVAALMWHCGQARRTELANLLAVTSDPTERAALKAGYPISFSFVRIAGLLAILGLAGFKMLTFVSFAGGGTPLGVMLLIAVTYGLVALIHICVTGYFLANAIFQIAKAVEQRRTLRHKPLKDAPLIVKGHRHHPFASQVKLVPVAVGRHELVFLGTDGSKGFLYDLMTWGVLLDSELSELIINQGDAAQMAVVADAGLRTQLIILDSDPVGAPQPASVSEPVLTPVNPTDASPPKSGTALREVGDKAALLVLGLCLLGSVSCARKNNTADTLDRVPVTILIGDTAAAPADELRETLLSLTPETPIATQAGSRSAIPDLTIQRAGQAEPVVSVAGAARPTFMEEFWGRQPSPEDQLADLRKRLAALDVTPLVSPDSATPSTPDAALIESTLVSQIAPPSGGEEPDAPAPLVVYLEDEPSGPGASLTADSGRPAGPVVHSAEEWRHLLADILSRDLVPIVLAYRVPRPADYDPTPVPVPVPSATRRLFTVQGSAATRDAAVKAAEGWLRREGVSGILSQTDDSGAAVTLRGDGEHGPVEIRFEAGDPEAALAALAAGRCDIAMGGSRSALSPVESAPMTEHVLGIVPAAAVVHPDNPVRQLTLAQLGGILTGRFSDWSTVSDGTGPITVYTPEASPEIDRLLVRRVPGLESTLVAKRMPESEIATAVAGDPGAIGLLPLNRAGAATQVLRLAADDLGLAIAPDASTVARDDYPLCQTYSFFLTATDPASEDENARLRRRAAREFVRYATLEVEGQALVAQAGLHSQNVRFQTWKEREQVVVARRVAESGPERRFRELVAGAEQASMVFRFGFNDTALDSRSLENVERLAALLLTDRAHAGSRIILIGFADSLGGDQACVDVSEKRAQAVREALLTHGVNAEVAAGFGKQLPVDTNSTDEGRARNRRVEVWLKRPETIAAQSLRPTPGAD